jgi:hypothetical protein
MENLFPFLVIDKEYFNISATDYQGGERGGAVKENIFLYCFDKSETEASQ